MVKENLKFFGTPVAKQNLKTNLLLIRALAMKKLFIFLAFLTVFTITHTAQAADPSPMIKIDEKEADRICKHFNIFVWWSCREEIKGMSIQADVRDWILKLRDNTELDAQILRGAFVNANAKKFDSDAMDYLTQNGLITVGSMPSLFNIMGGKKYDLELLSNCNSRNAVTNMTQPILSARRLNQPAILNCISIMSDVRNTLPVKASILKCKMAIDLVSFNMCIGLDMKAAREKQKDKK